MVCEKLMRLSSRLCCTSDILSKVSLLLISECIIYRIALSKVNVNDGCSVQVYDCAIIANYAICCSAVVGHM